MQRNLLKNLFSGAQLTPKWTSTYVQSPNYQQNLKATLLPGNGVGPELANQIEYVFSQLAIPIAFERIDKFNINDEDHLKQLKKNKIILSAAPFAQVGDSLEQHQLYKELNTFADVVTAFSIPGVKTRHDNVDIVVIRDNSEGEYSGLEHEVYKGVIESLKIITEKGSTRIAEYAFELAYLQNRKKVTAVHKANIMKLCDGMFLESCRKVAKKYPQIKYEEMIIDNCTMQLVKNPQQFDVMVLPNLYGSIVTGVCAGITGGAGLTSGANVGEDYLVFEQGAKNVGHDIANKGIANPTALLFSSIMMLRQMNLPRYADILAYGVNQTIMEGKYLTPDLKGGKGNTQQFIDKVVANSKDFQNKY